VAAGVILIVIEDSPSVSTRNARVLHPTMEFVEGLRNSLLIPGRENLVHAHERDIRYTLFVTNLVAKWRASATDTTVGPRTVMGRWPP
jgi:hypothetical protein